MRIFVNSTVDIVKVDVNHKVLSAPGLQKKTEDIPAYSVHSHGVDGVGEFIGHIEWCPVLKVLFFQSKRDHAIGPVTSRQISDFLHIESLVIGMTKQKLYG